MTRFISPTLTAKIAAVLCLTAFIGTHHAFAQEEIAGMKTNGSMTDNQMTYAPQKDTGFATVLSLVLPGAGQAYNGEWGKGAIQLGGAMFGVWMLADALFEDDTRVSAGFFIHLGFRVWSVIDAPLSANRINKRAQSAHLFQMDAGPFVVGADPVFRRTGAGGALTIHF